MNMYPAHPPVRLVKDNDGILCASLRIMMVSSTCRFIKCSIRLVRLVALPGHPSTGQSVDVAVRGKATRFFVGVGRGNGSGKVLDRLDRPCYLCRRASMDAAANSAPHSSHTTIWGCLTQ